LGEKYEEKLKKGKRETNGKKKEKGGNWENQDLFLSHK
jgi:hypothetical protein